MSSSEPRLVRSRPFWTSGDPSLCTVCLRDETTATIGSGMGLQRATAPAIVRPPPSMRGVGPIISRKNPLRRRLASTRKVDQLALPGVKIRTSVSLSRSSESVESKHTSIDMVSVGTRPKVSLASYAPRLISHFTASAPKELPERVTSRVPRVCQTWLRALRTDPVTAWSGWAKRDHQRTMYMDTSPAACQDHLMHPPLRLRPVRRRSFRFTALSASCRGMITF